jgi:hypothetical protein
MLTWDAVGSRPLIEHKARLAGLLSDVAPPLHYGDYHRGEGPVFHEAASASMPSARRRSRSRKARCDGMRVSSTPGRRGAAWIAFTSGDICSANGFPGQKRPGIDNQKQKPVILHVAVRDRRAGQEAQRLDR